MGFRNTGQVDFLRVDLGSAFMDKSGFTHGTIHRHHLAVGKFRVRIPATDYRRDTQLPTDDGGMRCAPTMVGDDRCCSLHDRYPVRVSEPGNQDGAIHESVDLARILDPAHRPACRKRTYRLPTREHTPRVPDLHFAQQIAPLMHAHSFRARLDDEEFTIGSVLGPFHIHRAAIMPLDRQSPSSQQKDLPIAQHQPLAIMIQGSSRLRAFAIFGIDKHPLLGAALLLYDRH